MKITEFQEAKINGNAFVTTLQSEASIFQASLQF